MSIFRDSSACSATTSAGAAAGFSWSDVPQADDDDPVAGKRSEYSHGNAPTAGDLHAGPMSDITQLLGRIQSDDPHAAEQLLPLLYDELRRLAAQKLAHEKFAQTLQATALVHEAYVRLVDVAKRQHWNSRGHFFAAAAEAMRRILVENARRRARGKHGGGRRREELANLDVAAPEASADLLALDEALEKLDRHDPQSAELVKLRFFTGLTIPQAAELLGISPRTANSLWSFARAWLRREMEG